MPTHHSVHLYARNVKSPQKKEIFCFKINEDGMIHSAHSMCNTTLPLPLSSLTQQLFELSSIDAHSEQEKALEAIREQLSQTGIQLTQPARACDMAMLYKPLGEIDDTIRFTLRSNGQIIFLSPKRPLTVYNNPLERIKPLPHQLT